jgi:DNA repair ATPase RecN
MLHTLLLLLFMTSAPMGASQPPAPPGQDDPARRGRAGRNADGRLSPIEVVNMLDAYAVLEAQNALQLSDAQYSQFVTRVRRLHQTRRQAQQERHRLIQQLRRLAGPQATEIDENAIRTNIKALRDLDERAASDVRKAYDAVDELLDARQQARFRIFEERLEARKLDLLMRARQGAATAPRR